MRKVQIGIVGWVVLALAGCPSGVEPGPSDARVRDSARNDASESEDVNSADDSAVPEEDTATVLDAAGDDVTEPDSGIDAGVDAPVTSDASVDSMVRDAPVDAAPACPCITVPSRCTMPATNSTGFSPGPGLQQQFVEMLACADRTIHAAIYQTYSNCVIDQIIARLATNTALSIQIVYDNEACPRVNGVLRCSLSRIESHPRVQLVQDTRSDLMHHKFMVVDNEQVWVSSANWSQQSFCSDANNAIVVSDSAVVAAYESEFQRMFTLRQSGPLPAAPPVTSGSYSVYIGPRTPINTPANWYNDMIAAVNSATTTIEFMSSAWTRMEIADALTAAHRRGVRVRGVVLGSYADMGPAQSVLRAGAPLREGDVHSKLMVIDGQTVIAGSANWSTAAFGNNENVLWIRDSTVAASYRADFETVYTASAPIAIAAP